MKIFIRITPQGLGGVYIESKLGQACAAERFFVFLRPFLREVDRVLKVADWKQFEAEGFDAGSKEISLVLILSPEGLLGIRLEGPEGAEKLTENFFQLMKPVLDKLNAVLEEYGSTYGEEGEVEEVAKRKLFEEVSDEEWERFLKIEKQGKIRLIPEEELDESKADRDGEAG